MGGHSSNPVVQAIASGVVAAGRRALLFNFRGVGESAGDASADPDDADEDFSAALACAAGTGAALVAAGYSFGAATALRIASADVRVTAVIAVAPPPALFDPAALRDIRGSLTVVAAEHDHFAPAGALADLVTGVPHARFEVVPGVDHFFGHGLARVAEIASEALSAV
jgi:alpha/beta superfamily hydrolase